jgi:D-sedoheptulose 7-phosphate isomerase
MSDQIETYFSRASKAFLNISKIQISEAVSLLEDALENRATIYIIGNGGSAATASHFAVDIGKTLNSKGKPGRAISLCDNSSVITAISNDNSFDEVFEKQLSCLANPNDVLVSISASGNSKNLIRAVNFANKNDITTLSLTGFSGGALSNISKFSLHVPTIEGDYGIAEDCHSILCHYISEQLRKIV